MPTFTFPPAASSAASPASSGSAPLAALAPVGAPGLAKGPSGSLGGFAHVLRSGGGTTGVGAASGATDGVASAVTNGVAVAGSKRPGADRRADDFAAEAAALEASARHAAHLAPPQGAQSDLLPQTPPPAPASSPPRPSAAAPPSLEELLPELVRKIAWSGDSHRGAVRLEVGAGALAGAILLVQAEGGRVHVKLSAPGVCHAETEAWRARIEARLAERGLDVEAVQLE
jgi:hypothetical protein